MNQRDTTPYQERLASEQQELLAQLRSLGVQDPANPHDWIATPNEPSDSEADPNNLGDRSEDWQEDRGTLDALETRYNNIGRALKKIADKRYGCCEICQAPIETARLDVNPAARTCSTHLEDEAGLPK